MCRSFVNCVGVLVICVFVLTAFLYCFVYVYLFIFECEEYRTLSILTHTSKIVTKIIFGRIEKKIDENLAEDQFGFPKNRGTREASSCLRNIVEKMKGTDRITNDVFQRAKEERLLLNLIKNRCHSLIGHTIRHNEFAVNILEGAIFKKKWPWKDLDYNT